ncbi:hypothetical protein SELMODRAFT_430165 [Selaginella moellendorffii]|uniref:Apple domain-containing protein n=1 Tax=Selaginella moellendorffii TaxID=88036 RepID=D8T8J7_SELML|nr:hypothetical protein SELMODRAFT_430165 [Selaginella moellendorffii]
MFRSMCSWCCSLPFLLALLSSSQSPAAAAVAPIPVQELAAGDLPALEFERWDHNYSCIFDNYRAFSYLHIGYVPYFNLSNRSPSYATLDDCLDSCTADCSCSGIVYDVPKDSCYQYHDYIPVQSIQLLPVNAHDTISAYIKIQRGYNSGPGGYYSGAPPRRELLLSSLGILVLLGLVLPPFLPQLHAVHH